MQLSRMALFVAVAFLTACSGPTTRPEDIGTRLITMPGGQRVRVEVKIRPEDIMRGMMFREKLDPDRGMMFLHKPPGKYAYWMYQVKIPLDIIWMDEQGNIVRFRQIRRHVRTPARFSARFTVDRRRRRWCWNWPPGWPRNMD